MAFVSGCGFLAGCGAAFCAARRVGSGTAAAGARVSFSREIFFALGFLLVVLLLSEPFLAQESQKVEFPFRLRLPMVGSVVPAGTTGVNPSIMNQLKSIDPAAVLCAAGLLYTACLVKLAEIRRQDCRRASS